MTLDCLTRSLGLLKKFKIIVSIVFMFFSKNLKELSKEVCMDFPLECMISERHSQKVCMLR